MLKKEDLHITDIYMQEEKREAMYNGHVGSLKPKEKDTSNYENVC